MILRSGSRPPSFLTKVLLVFLLAYGCTPVFSPTLTCTPGTDGAPRRSPWPTETGMEVKGPTSEVPNLVMTPDPVSLLWV